ncbi:MAG: ATPase central domain protein [Bacteroidota bacterium]|nr:ATPase central domain protein [Bacteroidota bacterium]
MISYIASEGLRNAKEVALFLNRPLLLSGEPGTGKTKFAEYIAYEDDPQDKKNLYVFNTKSVSQAQDLFYIYDAVAHFANRQKSAVEFITLQALGKSIINAFGREATEKMLLEKDTNNYQLQLLRDSADKEKIIKSFLDGCDGKNSVVLIDEIDKAPRDFPNDILNEIDNLEFDIKELGLNFNLDKTHNDIGNKIFVLLTSNFEKNLPDAFLRRCIYFHINFPEKVEDLIDIIKIHIPEIDSVSISPRIEEFLRIRNETSIQKKPATSELIDCIKWLYKKNTLDKQIIGDSTALSTLLKKNEDIQVFSK